jgi:hypothetical protein
MGMDPEGDIFFPSTKSSYNIPHSYIIHQNQSDPSKWKCRLFGIDNFFFIPMKGNEPNIFWRTMQYLLLGNKWSKNDNNIFNIMIFNRNN